MCVYILYIYIHIYILDMYLHMCVYHECVLTQIWMIHVAHTDESRCTCELVMLQIWMSHIEHMDESCRTCEWVMSDIWMSHVAHVNKSRRTYEWATSHVRMSHVAHMEGFVSHTAHREDQTRNIWISRSMCCPDRSFQWWNSGYSSEFCCRFLGTPVKTWLKCTGTPVKICLKFWQS